MWIVLSCVILYAMECSSTSLHPVVIVPGKGGNQLYVKLNKPHPTGSGCDLKTDWFRIWLDVYQLTPGQLPCWAENMKLNYNVTSGISHHQDGTEFYIPGFGSTHTVEELDPSWAAWLLGKGEYMKPLVHALVKLGYRRGVNVRAAPFDFRFAPHSQKHYLKRLRGLIEETYHSNEGKRVLLVGHSTGGLVLHYFLQQQTMAWKNHFVYSMVTISTPWKGTAMTLWVMASGYNYYIPVVDPLVIRAPERTYETNVWMLPKGDIWQGKTLVSTLGRNYTTNDYKQFFTDIGYPIGFDIMEHFLEPTYELRPPGVDVHCWFGVGYPTPTSLKYTNGFPDEKPVATHTDGDGTVTRDSLEGCQDWSSGSHGSTKVSTRVFTNQQHKKILSSPDLHEALVEILNGKQFELNTYNVQ